MDTAERPRTAKEWYDKGVALAEEGKFAEALAAFEEVLKLDPKLASAWYSKGYALSGLGEHQKAIEAYDRAIELDPKDPIAWNNKGNALSSLGKYQEAIAAYDRAIELDPKDAKAWYNKGNALSSLGKHQEAIAAYDRAIELDPKDPSAWNNKGVALDSLGKYQEAIAALDRAIELDPKYADPWNNKGVALGSLGKYQEAIAALDRAIELDPKYAKAWNNKGVALDSLGKYQEAIAAYDRAIELDPKYAKAWSNKGVGLQESRRYRDALDALETAVRIDSTNPLFHTNLADVLLTLGDVPRSEAAVDKALALDAESAAALSVKARIHIEKRQYAEADSALARAVSKKPGDVRLLLWQAYAQYLLMEYANAGGEKAYQEDLSAIIRRLERISRLTSHEGKEIKAYIHYFLGCFYFKSGERAEAVRALRACRELKTGCRAQYAACDLLGDIWNHAVRPSLWRWWFDSPLHTWPRRIIGGAILLFVGVLLAGHPFVRDWLWKWDVNWTLYGVLPALLLAVFVLPIVDRLKAKDIEVDLQPPPDIGPVLSPSVMEARLSEVESLPSRSKP